MDERDTMRALVEAQRHGVLCTAHTGLGGWPFGSVVPYVLDPHGDPLVFLSDLAEHTRNLQADPRASLLVAEASDPELVGSTAQGDRITLSVRLLRTADGWRITGAVPVKAGS